MNSSNLNLTATHNGFGLNHNNSMNQTHQNHFNSTTSSNSTTNNNTAGAQSSVLTYRSNRRSMDRSDNKISDTNSPSSSTSSTIRNTLSCNDSIQEGISQSRSYFIMCLRIIYKTFIMFINNGFNKRRPANLNNNNPNGRMPESMFSRILSILRYRVIGIDMNNYSHSDSVTEHTSYIERIDDEQTENSDPSINTTANTKLQTSFTPSVPVAVELPTGNERNFVLFFFSTQE